MNKNMHGLRSLLELAMHQAGLSSSLARRLPKQVWEAAVGREIATRAQPTHLTAGVLHVLVEDHRWRDQLDAMRMELISRVNARLGKALVRELHFGLAHAGALPARRPLGRAIGAADNCALEQAGRGREHDLPEHLRGGAKLGGELGEAFLRAGRAAQRSREEARQ